MEDRAEGDVGRLDRHAGWVVCEPDALLPHRVVQQGCRVGVWREATEQRDRRNRRQNERADEAVADERATPESGLLIAKLEDLDRLGARLFRAARAVTVFDALVFAHELLGPVHSSESDTEQAERDAEPEEEVVLTNRAEVSRHDREHHVSRESEHAADDRQKEQERHLALGVLVLLRVKVGLARVVRRKTGVFYESSGRNRRPYSTERWHGRTTSRGAGSATVGCCHTVVVLCHALPFRAVLEFLSVFLATLVGLRRQPDGDADDGAEAENPDEQALGNRSEVAEVKSTG